MGSQVPFSSVNQWDRLCLWFVRWFLVVYYYSRNFFCLVLFLLLHDSSHNDKTYPYSPFRRDYITVKFFPLLFGKSIHVLPNVHLIYFLPVIVYFSGIPPSHKSYRLLTVPTETPTFPDSFLVFSFSLLQVQFLR